MNWIAAGAACCSLAVVAGAFGAHGLANRLDVRGLELWETASRYLMYGGIGVALTGLVSQLAGRPFTAAAGVLLLGTAVFSGTVFALAVGGPRWLGAVTPLGGLLMIAGFSLLALGAVRGSGLAP